MEDKIFKPDLRVPEQKTASLSFCDTSPKAFRAWIKQLPVANIGEVSRQLYHAIIEINQLFLAPQTRLQLLELVRGKIHFVCGELSRHFLGRAVALPDKQRKIANLSQALQLHLASGYKLCLLEALDESGPDKNRKLVAMATHRAISELAFSILRAHQLYYPGPPQSWLECHRMFRFAQSNKLAGVMVEDKLLQSPKASTIADSYKRLLLLGCASPNQLRQPEIRQIYDLFETWTGHTHCGPNTDDDSLFAVNLERDHSPVYSSLLEHKPSGEVIGFDTRALAALIAEHLDARVRKQPLPETLRIPDNVSETLLAHLSKALGTLAQRNFNRITSQGSLEICVGLTATHYFIAGQTSFTEFVTGNDRGPENEENLFIRASRRRQDAWAGAHDAGPSDEHLHAADTPINYRGSFGNTTAVDNDKNRPRSHSALLVNTSPGGYCASWESGVPASMQAGEILGVREQRSHPWSIAVVRWIRQIRNKGTQVGIELLAPSGSPCGVRLIQKVGNSSEYLRGILLPEISVANRAATLITPRLPFQPGSRISMLHNGREEQGQLTTMVSATGSISQFELRLQKNAVAAARAKSSSVTGASEDDFDSLWPSL